MNETTFGTKTVKISFPKTLANEFTEEARLKFNDCRWLTIEFYRMKSRLLDYITKNDEFDVKFFTEQLRQEMLSKMKEYYSRNV